MSAFMSGCRAFQVLMSRSRSPRGLSSKLLRTLRTSPPVSPSSSPTNGQPLAASVLSRTPTSTPTTNVRSRPRFARTRSRAPRTVRRTARQARRCQRGAGGRLRPGPARVPARRPGPSRRRRPRSCYPPRAAPQIAADIPSRPPPGARSPGSAQRPPSCGGHAGEPRVAARDADRDDEPADAVTPRLRHDPAARGVTERDAPVRHDDDRRRRRVLAARHRPHHRQRLADPGPQRRLAGRLGRDRGGADPVAQGRPVALRGRPAPGGTGSTGSRPNVARPISSCSPSRPTSSSTAARAAGIDVPIDSEESSANTMRACRRTRDWNSSAASTRLEQPAVHRRRPGRLTRRRLPAGQRHLEAGGRDRLLPRPGEQPVAEAAGHGRRGVLRGVLPVQDDDGVLERERLVAADEGQLPPVGRAVAVQRRAGRLRAVHELLRQQERHVLRRRAAAVAVGAQDGGDVAERVPAARQRTGELLLEAAAGVQLALAATGGRAEGGGDGQLAGRRDDGVGPDDGDAGPEQLGQLRRAGPRPPAAARWRARRGPAASGRRPAAGRRGRRRRRPAPRRRPGRPRRWTTAATPAAAGPPCAAARGGRCRTGVSQPVSSAPRTAAGGAS